MFTARQSQGIPVGPTASHILAEACLNDVDQLLLDEGYKFTRYADNFRIFVDDRRTSVEALQHVIYYLYTAHRLSIQDSKTRFESTDEFRSSRLEDPAQKEAEESEQVIEDLIHQVRQASGYEDIGIDDLGEDADKELRNVLKDLFGEALQSRPVKYGMLRHLLRRAKSMRTNVLHTDVLGNLELLIPVFRDVCIYLLATFPKIRNRARSVGDRLLTIAQQSDFSCTFVRMWALHVLATKPSASKYEDAVALARSSEGELGIRPMALLARAFKKTHWIRGRKERVMDLPPWDRRAVIYAGQILPAHERTHWLRMISNRGDVLDKAIAIRLLSWN